MARHQRRTHSSIDKLPAELRDTLRSMIIDGQWPAGYEPDYDGRPRYQDVVAYAQSQGHTLAHSSVGRWAKQLRVFERMRTSAAITRDVMADLTSENASATQKAAGEMITAAAIDFMSDHDSFSSKELRDIATAMKSCAGIAIDADQYIREQAKRKAEAADQKITAVAVKKHIDPETLRMIREEIYGIVK